MSAAARLPDCLEPLVTTERAQNRDLTPAALVPTLKTLKTSVLRVLRVPLHDPFLDQPPQ